MSVQPTNETDQWKFFGGCSICKMSAWCWNIMPSTICIDTSNLVIITVIYDLDQHKLVSNQRDTDNNKTPAWRAEDQTDMNWFPLPPSKDRICFHSSDSNNNNIYLILKLTYSTMIISIVWTDDHSLLRESNLDVWQSCKTPITFSV